jgi:N-methylhydantoinase A
VEFINIRVSVRVPIPGAELKFNGQARRARDAVKGYRDIYFPEPGGYVRTPIYSRGDLLPGDEFSGQAVIEDEGSTLVVGPGSIVRVAASHNVIVTLN